MRKTLLLSTTTAAAGLLLLSACGSSGGSDTAPSPAAGNIHVASTSLGKVLVDGDGHTLYRLTADTPGHSTCGSQCLAYWPAVAAASSTTLPDVDAELGSATAPGGVATVTVGGWPLYTFVGDSTAGDVTGEGMESFGGTWYAVSADGKPVTAQPGSDDSTDDDTGGYGY
jgi:predicted lipoprotein with Yx(FWY)xxD motif